MVHGNSKGLMYPVITIMSAREETTRWLTQNQASNVMSCAWMVPLQLNIIKQPRDQHSSGFDTILRPLEGGWLTTLKALGIHSPYEWLGTCCCDRSIICTSVEVHSWWKGLSKGHVLWQLNNSFKKSMKCWYESQETVYHESPWKHTSIPFFSFGFWVFTQVFWSHLFGCLPPPGSRSWGPRPPSNMLCPICHSPMFIYHKAYQIRIGYTPYSGIMIGFNTLSCIIYVLRANDLRQ